MIQRITDLQGLEGFINDIKEDECFSDPHFSFDSKNLYMNINEKHYYLYCVKDNSKIIGLFLYAIIPNDLYIEQVVGLSRSKEAYSEMLEFLRVEYSGFQIDFVFNPKNIALKSVLEERNATIECEEQKMMWEKSDSREIYVSPNVVELSSQYEDVYKKLHTEDTYWTADRILNRKDVFAVYLLKDNENVVGYIDVTINQDVNEPYDLWVSSKFSSLENKKALISYSQNRNDTERMMVVLGVDDKETVRAYEECGFKKLVGQNSIYASYVLE